jgi:glycosyltransferase involved in cell wall biosynthesis
MKSTQYPSISVVTATFNSERTISRVYASIAGQNYPKDKVELIVVDGGSTDRTIEIASGFGAQIIPVDPVKQNAEYNKAIGISRATGSIIAMIDHDNVLPSHNWMRSMIAPFLDNPNIVGVETLRYHYDARESLLDRYFALFGTGDPFVWYLGRADRLSYMFDRYNLAGTILADDPYYTVRFDPKQIPTIGANGFLVRRKLLLKEANAAPDMYFDMDVNVDLIIKGFNTYAFVHESILHLTGYANIWSYLRRRMLFMNQYHVGDKSGRRKNRRRYEIYRKDDVWRLLYAIICSVSVVIPLIDSVRGWIRIRDVAWFLHPIMGIGFFVIYSWVIIKSQVSRYASKIMGK